MSGNVWQCLAMSEIRIWSSNIAGVGIYQIGRTLCSCQWEYLSYDLGINNPFTSLNVPKKSFFLKRHLLFRLSNFDINLIWSGATKHFLHHKERINETEIENRVENYINFECEPSI